MPFYGHASDHPRRIPPHPINYTHDTVRDVALPDSPPSLCAAFSPTPTRNRGGAYAPLWQIRGRRKGELTSLTFP